MRGNQTTDVAPTLFSVRAIMKDECEERACSEWLLCDPEVGVCGPAHFSL